MRGDVGAFGASVGLYVDGVLTSFAEGLKQAIIRPGTRAGARAVPGPVPGRAPAPAPARALVLAPLPLLPPPPPPPPPPGPRVQCVSRALFRAHTAKSRFARRQAPAAGSPSPRCRTAWAPCRGSGKGCSVKAFKLRLSLSTLRVVEGSSLSLGGGPNAA
jgi:hypothetical protein